MPSATICLKPINDLLGQTFFVPAYQRGYRWTGRQVEDLLDDLWNFQDVSAEKRSYYCLQPIVVKRRDDGSWELVDGQQRLITIYLILTSTKLFLEGMGKKRFGVTFATRNDTCEAFLKDIDPSKSDENIDYHHICAASRTIEQWFDSRDGSHRLRLLQCLTNDDAVGRNVKVIWYELPEKDDPIDAFTRLNVGKIPLTNAELIRALFLHAGNFDLGTVSLQQLKIASEWDAIEKVLQMDAFWYFLHDGNNLPASRIEYVFQLIAREPAQQPAASDDPYSTFHFYNQRLSTAGIKADAEWREVKRYFMTLEEWFNDRSLYHLIGYLIHEGDDLLSIRNVGKNVGKRDFQRALKRRIFKRTFGSEPPSNQNDEWKTLIRTRIDDLEYGNSTPNIRAILLLFNIATLLQNQSSNIRFPFDTFKKQRWDIEHVRSVESGKPQRPAARRQWLESARDYLAANNEENDFLARTQSLLDSAEIVEELFDQLYLELLEHFGEAESPDIDNGIGNLTLLDIETNRSYKNAVFPVKRSRILGLDRVGTFVPLCTKNVFLKCYSRNIQNMLAWHKEDSKSHQEAIVTTLDGFFASATEGEI